MSLLSLAVALTLAQPGPALPLMESGAFSASGYTAFLTIAPDGHWTATGEQVGNLTPTQTAQIKALADTVVMTTFQGGECISTPTLMVLRVARGEVRYSDGCGPQAHVSVTRLLLLAESFTTSVSNPMVARIDRWHSGDEERKSATMLMRDGVWTTDNGVGNTNGQELADLIAAFRYAELAVRPAQPATNCRGDYWHELRVPGRGTLRWIAYCQAPSPSLAVALGSLRTLVTTQR